MERELLSTFTVAGPEVDNLTYGQNVTFTAVVTNANTTGAPTGSVSFYDASSGATCSALGTSTLIGTDSAADSTTSTTSTWTTSTTTLAVGSHTILACYNATGDFTNSSNTTTQTVNKANATVSEIGRAHV